MAGPEAPRWRRYLRLFGPNLEADIDEEVRHHIELLVEHYRARGLSQAEARAAASRRFGQVEVVKSDCARIGQRRMRARARAEMVDRLVQDARFAVRTFARTPLFSATVLLTLGLGIGGSTAVFSVVNAALLQPLPYGDPDEVISIRTRFERVSGSEWEFFGMSVPEYRDHAAATRSFSATAAYSTSRVNLADAARAPDRILTVAATGEFFTVMGVQPALGRGFRPGEDAAGAPCVAVLSDELWRTRYGGSAAALNQTIRLDGEPCTIVGVMPRGFFFPVPETKLWRPFVLDANAQLASERESHWFSAIGRLKDGVTLATAETELKPMMASWRDKFEHYIGHYVVIQPFREDLIANDRRVLLIVLSGVGLLLVIICSNLANLLLVRGEARRREIAVRAALGAGRARLIRQLLTESVLLASAGGLLGLAIGPLLLRVLIRLHPDALPLTAPVVFDARVLLFTFLVSMAAAILFGLIPALQTARLQLQDALKGRGVTATQHSVQVRHGLVVVEIALSLAVVVAAGLLVRSYQQIIAVPLGIQEENLLALDVTLPASQYREKPRVSSFYDRLRNRVAELPGVQSAGLLSVLPLRTGPPSDGFRIEGRPEPQLGEPDIEGGYILATPGAFEAMGVPLVRGRRFDARDVAGAPLVGIVDETAARLFWPGQDPIGRRIRYYGADSAWITIVGLVGTVRYSSMLEDPRANVYVPHAQRPRAFYEGRDMILLVRANGEPAPIIAGVRQVVKQLDPVVPVTRASTMNEIITRAAGRPRFAAALMALFGVAALMVGALGIYGVLSYLVQTRTNELGIRMALGAETRQLQAFIVGQGMSLALIGIAAGTALALASTRWLGTVLFGISETDLTTYAVVIAILAVTSLLASWLPARRATRVYPLTA
ncbi:MAG TPA: ABC transporter permease, partial [Longimicrobiales bacterium]|nr:ABC transporter permease [Longimicrobiales bacterium]